MEICIIFYNSCQVSILWICAFSNNYLCITWYESLERWSLWGSDYVTNVCYAKTKLKYRRVKEDRNSSLVIFLLSDQTCGNTISQEEHQQVNDGHPNPQE